LIRIEVLHVCRDSRGVRSQILLEDLTVFTHDERHHTGIPILGRISDERKSPSHFSGCHVAHRAAGGILSLARQPSIVVAVKWDGSSLALVTFSGRLCDKRSDRACRRAFSGLPIETVVLSFVAQDFLRILFFAVLIVCGGCVFLFCVYQGSKCPYRKGLIAA